MKVLAAVVAVKSGVVEPRIELSTACSNRLAGSVGVCKALLCEASAAVANNPPATWDCRAASLSFTRSAGDAFFNAACTAADDKVDDSEGDAALDTSCSRLAAPGLTELTEPMNLLIGRNLESNYNSGVKKMAYQSGRHFLQIPGPTNVPDRVLRAIDNATIDHRSAEAGELGLFCLNGMKAVFQTKGAVTIFPASGTGAWEAALVNTLSPGDSVLVFDNGHFASLWARMAKNLNLNVELIAGDWHRAPDAEALRVRLENDRQHDLKAVMVVHNETSTGVKSDIAAIRRAMDAVGHPALLLVDAISSLGSMDYRHDEWGADVTVAGSQKGLMLPPGLSFNAISEKALAASTRSTMTRSYWRWEEMLENGRKGFFPYTPATNLLYGLREALKMLLEEEGLANVFQRHDRHAEATRRAVRAWGLEVFALNPAEYSSALTAVLLPAGFNEAELRAIILKNFNMSLGAGLNKIAGKVFRIGHLGSFNDLMLAGTLCGVEMGLELAGVPCKKGGVTEAMAYLTAQAKEVGSLAAARV